MKTKESKSPSIWIKTMDFLHDMYQLDQYKYSNKLSSNQSRDNILMQLISRDWKNEPL